MNTPSGRIDSYTDRNGNANYVQGGVSGGKSHTHSVPANNHLDITRSDGSKASISSGKSGSSGKGGGSGGGGGGGK